MTFEEKHKRLLEEYLSPMDSYMSKQTLLYKSVDRQIKANFNSKTSEKLIKLSDKCNFTIYSNEYILFVNLLYKLTFKNETN